ncbi:MAG: hypothetical protein JW850_02970 [Thermoflexales bacterium]|nr:hypothetical protein [Thermoflexales bacterium]
MDFFKRLFQKSEPGVGATRAPRLAATAGVVSSGAPASSEAEPLMAETAGAAPPVTQAPPALDQLAQRVSRAAESILENESLTDGLDETAAEQLLSWGIACAETAARDTASLGEAEAEEALSPRMRATRMLMRSVKAWIASRPTAGTDPAQLNEIVEQAAIVYGWDLDPSAERLGAFLEQQNAAGLDPQGMIAGLRELLTSQEENNDQKRPLHQPEEIE